MEPIAIAIGRNPRTATVNLQRTIFCCSYHSPSLFACFCCRGAVQSRGRGSSVRSYRRFPKKKHETEQLEG